MTMKYNLGNRVVNNYLVSLGEEDGYVNVRLQCDCVSAANR